MKCFGVEELNCLPAYSGINRTPGIHVTDIITDLLVESGLVDYPPSTEEDKQANFGKGFAWEVQKDDQLRQKFGKSAPFRPPEVTVDGILCSPDGLWEWKGVDCITEYKATLTSLNKPLEDRIYWKYQMASYCHALQVRHCMLFVLFYCGDWKPPKTTDRAYWVEFSKQEIREIWDMIVKHGKRKGML